MHLKPLAAILPFALAFAACSAPPFAPPLIPANLRPELAEVVLQTLSATGVQIYECQTVKDRPAESEWFFTGPEAQLRDAQGRKVGTHFAGPHWQSNDGSRIVGAVTARAEAPRAGAIPWLLLKTRSAGPAGAFARVTSIQRVDTMGGLAPPAGDCTSARSGERRRVDYTADYVLFTAQ